MEKHRNISCCIMKKKINVQNSMHGWSPWWHTKGGEVCVYIRADTDPLGTWAIGQGWEDSFAFAHTDAISIFNSRVYTCKSNTLHVNDGMYLTDYLQAFTNFKRERESKASEKGKRICLPYFLSTLVFREGPKKARKTWKRHYMLGALPGASGNAWCNSKGLFTAPPRRVTGTIALLRTPRGPEVLALTRSKGKTGGFVRNRRCGGLSPGQVSSKPHTCRSPLRAGKTQPGTPLTCPTVCWLYCVLFRQLIEFATYSLCLLGPVFTFSTFVWFKPNLTKLSSLWKREMVPSHWLQCQQPSNNAHFFSVSSCQGKGPRPLQLLDYINVRT